MKQENLDKIRHLRHELHRCAELSLQETETAKVIRQFLSENTSLEIEQRDGWFYAVKRGKNPGAGSLAFRADMDALPMAEEPDLPYASVHAGISHKCGHDGHCAALCGLAMEIDKLSPGKTVYLLFQKAEEIGAGGSCLADLILEKGIGEVYAFHNVSGYPENDVVYRRGLTQPASEGLIIRFIGKVSHASAPEEGINPAEAIALTVLYLQQRLKDPHRGMVLGTVTGMTAGTGDFGLSAGDGTLCLTLRAEYEEEMAALKQSLLDYAAAQADAAGLMIGHEIVDYFPETRNSDLGINRVLKAAGELGLTTREMDPLWRASEDFGYCLKVCPGAMFYLGSGETWPALHTAGYDFNDRLLETAADLFLTLAVEE